MSVLSEKDGGTIVIEAGEDPSGLAERCASVLALAGADGHHMLVTCRDSERAQVELALSAIVSRAAPGPRLLSLSPDRPDEHVARVLEQVKTEKVAFSVDDEPLSLPPWDQLSSESSLMCWVPETAAPAASAQVGRPVRDWLASTDLLRGLSGLGPLSAWGLLHIAAAITRAGRKVNWPSPRMGSTGVVAAPQRGEAPVLMRDSSVLALVPHYRCEQWLGECLESLLAQTRQPDAVVVIDDHSQRPPSEIVGRFAGVTLLTAEENVGPYRLMQEVINTTCYDAYLMQDADDWSASDRLQILLAEGERSGAEWVSSQELRILCDSAEVVPVTYPLDVNKAYQLREAHPILQCASLIARDLVQRLGGFATALRFGGDSEFLRRAGHVARTINVPHYCYFHRHRDNSLTTDPNTGLQSSARQALMLELRQWAEKNKASIARGEIRPNELTPYAVASPVRLKHLLGPRLGL